VPVPRAGIILNKIRILIGLKKLTIIPSVEIFAELIPVSQIDERQYKRRWRQMHRLVNWSKAIKPAAELLKDDFISFANTGHASNPYLTGRGPYYKAFKNLIDMTEPSSPEDEELKQVVEQELKSKSEFASVINSAGNDWHGNVKFPKTYTFEQYWTETMGVGSDEANCFPKKMANDLAESLGVGEACRKRGLDKLLSIPTILITIGFWTHSWFDQVIKGSNEKTSVDLDFRHSTIAAAVGTFVTGDIKLRDRILAIPGHNIRVYSLQEFELILEKIS
jgi:hypothetical protein